MYVLVSNKRNQALKLLKIMCSNQSNPFIYCIHRFINAQAFLNKWLVDQEINKEFN